MSLPIRGLGRGPLATAGLGQGYVALAVVVVLSADVRGARRTAQVVNLRGAGIGAVAKRQAVGSATGTEYDATGRTASASPLAVDLSQTTKRT